MRTPPTSIAELPGELRKNSELARLRTENRDLRIALQTSNDHGDLLQEHLYRLSAKLKAEVNERQTAEQKLHQMLQAATSEKVDLEILVQILIDQGDQSAEEGGKARIDALTQIANRRRFDEFLSQEWSKHFRVRQPLALLMCDVDHFKLYNDYYGHQAGDECLKSVANAIASCLRAQDLVARCGGEEFAVVLPNAGRQAAVATAVRVRAAVAAASIPHAKSPTAGYVSLSIGALSRTPQTQGPDGLREFLEEADQLLYLAKRRGRNRIADQRRGDFQTHEE